MNNEEKATKIMETFTEVYGVNIERDSHIYSACMQMAQWKDRELLRALQSKVKELSNDLLAEDYIMCP